MAITKNKSSRQHLKITTTDKNGKQKDIRHQDNLKLLGISLSHNQKWDHFLTKCKKSLTRQLKTRLSAVKMVAKTADKKFSKMATKKNGQKILPQIAKNYPKPQKKKKLFDFWPFFLMFLLILLYHLIGLVKGFPKRYHTWWLHDFSGVLACF